MGASESKLNSVSNLKKKKKKKKKGEKFLKGKRHVSNDGKPKARSNVKRRGGHFTQVTHNPMKAASE